MVGPLRLRRCCVGGLFGVGFGRGKQRWQTLTHVGGWFGCLLRVGVADAALDVGLGVADAISGLRFFLFPVVACLRDFSEVLKDAAGFFIFVSVFFLAEMRRDLGEGFLREIPCPYLWAMPLPVANNISKFLWGNAAGFGRGLPQRDPLPLSLGDAPARGK